MPVRRLVRFAVAWIGCIGVLAANAADLPRFSAQKIDLPRSYQPTAFDSKGDLAGFKLLDVQARWGQEQLGFRRLEGRPAQVFRDLSGGDRHGAWLDMNAAGFAVGYGTVAGDPDHGFLEYRFRVPNGARAEVLTPDGEVVSLAPVLVPGVDSFARAVNRHGQVAGEIYTFTRDGNASPKPFVWSAEGGVRYPYGTGGPANPVTVGAINDRGQVAGSTGEDVGYIWDPDRGILEFARDIYEVRGLSDKGLVIGRDGYEKAFVWQRSMGKRYLPLLRPHDKHNCDPNDINDDGWIVGVCDRVPVLWIPDGADGYQMADLDDLIVPPVDPKDRPFDWSEAIRIERDGRVLLRTYDRDVFGESTPSIGIVLTPIAMP